MIKSMKSNFTKKKGKIKRKQKRKILTKQNKKETEIVRKRIENKVNLEKAKSNS